MSKEAMKQALEALEYTTNLSRFLLNDEANIGPMLKADEAITSLRQAIAEAEKQEQGEPVAATDIQISYEAHAEDPLDWNDLNFKECWHKGFADGFKAAETFHKIGVSE